MGEQLIENGTSRQNVLILAHGAGAPMDSPFMQIMAEGLVQHPALKQQLAIWRFNFPYMQAAQQSGKRRPPNTQKILLSHWNQQIDKARLQGFEKTFIGGKSMGGRMASMVADENNVNGLVCLGYPFHPPGKPDKLRTTHLQTLQTAALFCQGERDTMGNRTLVESLYLSANITHHWLADGDHGFKPRVKSGHTLDSNLTDSINAMAKWLEPRLLKSI